MNRLSRHLLESVNLRDCGLPHWFRGKVYRWSSQPEILWVGVARDGVALWAPHTFELVDEPGVFEPPTEPDDLAAELRSYVTQWPVDAEVLHWHEAVGVDPRVRLVEAERLHDAALRDRDAPDFPELYEPGAWSGAMAVVGQVEDTGDPTQTYEALVRRWRRLEQTAVAAT